MEDCASGKNRERCGNENLLPVFPPPILHALNALINAIYSGFQFISCMLVTAAGIKNNFYFPHGSFV